MGLAQPSYPDFTRLSVSSAVDGIRGSDISENPAGHCNVQGRIDEYHEINEASRVNVGFAQWSVSNHISRWPD